MKKPILLLILLFSFLLNSYHVNGQVEVTDSKEKFSEFGLNVTSFVNEFISLNSNDSDIGDYMVTYKYHLGKSALRIGLGGQFRQVDDETEGGGGRVTKDNSFDFRIGYEVKTKITPRWGFYFGADATLGWAESKATTFNFEQVELTTSLTEFGGGPIAGIQFFINPRISLATEASLYYTYSESREVEKFSVNTLFNTDELSTSNNFDFGLPTSLYFVIRF